MSNVRLTSAQCEQDDGPDTLPLAWLPFLAPCLPLFYSMYAISGRLMWPQVALAAHLRPRRLFVHRLLFISRPILCATPRYILQSLAYHHIQIHTRIVPIYIIDRCHSLLLF